MAIRTDLPRIKSSDKPSYINREMAEDAALGGFFLDFIPLMDFSKTGKSIILGITALSAAHGGWRGKRRMEQEQRDGKLVEDPTYFNYGAGLGALAGYISHETVSLIERGTSTENLRNLLATTAIGVVCGSILGRRHMVEEFNEAVALKKAMTATTAPQTMLQQPALQTAHTTSNTMIQIQASTADNQGTLATAQTRHIS